MAANRIDQLQRSLIKWWVRVIAIAYIVVGAIFAVATFLAK